MQRSESQMEKARERYNTIKNEKVEPLAKVLGRHLHFEEINKQIVEYGLSLSLTEDEVNDIFEVKRFEMW